MGGYSVVGDTDVFDGAGRAGTILHGGSAAQGMAQVGRAAAHGTTTLVGELHAVLVVLRIGGLDDLTEVGLFIDDARGFAFAEIGLGEDGIRLGASAHDVSSPLLAVPNIPGDRQWMDAGRSNDQRAKTPNSHRGPRFRSQPSCDLAAEGWQVEAERAGCGGPLQTEDRHRRKGNKT